MKFKSKKDGISKLLSLRVNCRSKITAGNNSRQKELKLNRKIKIHYGYIVILDEKDHQKVEHGENHGGRRHFVGENQQNVNHVSNDDTCTSHF